MTPDRLRSILFYCIFILNKPQNDVSASLKPQNDVSASLKPQNDVSEKLPEGLSLKENAVLRAIMADTGISIAQLAATTALSASTIDRVIKSLKDKHILFRTGSTKQVKWQVNLA